MIHISALLGRRVAAFKSFRGSFQSTPFISPNFANIGRRISFCAMAHAEIISDHDHDAHNVKEGTLSARRVFGRRKPMCLYYTQGLCTYMDRPEHMEKFSHTFPELEIETGEIMHLQPQPFDYYLVLDLEGKVEILEFPVLMVNSRTLEVVDHFHRFVKPAAMGEARLTEYIQNKYGCWGLDRVWHDTAIPFVEVIYSFEAWLKSHNLWDSKRPGTLHQAAFVICGNWDLKTKIPEQCITSQISLPTYFLEWINLKDVYLNFYKQEARGMMAMLKGLGIPMRGTHHVGLDDAVNISRVLQHMLSHGALVNITAKRESVGSKSVHFCLKDRVK